MHKVYCWVISFIFLLIAVTSCAPRPTKLTTVLTAKPSVTLTDTPLPTATLIPTRTPTASPSSTPIPTPLPPLPRLYVDDSFIKRDDSGEVVWLKGLYIDEERLSSDFLKLAQDWGANLLLIGIDVRNGIRNAQISNLNRFIDLAGELGIYCILDPSGKDPSPVPDVKVADSMQLLAKEFKNKSNVIYAIWAEPHAEDLPNVGSKNYHLAWKLWLDVGSEIATAIRSEDKQAILIVPGARKWARDLSYYQYHPFPFDNVVYTVHDYWAEPQYYNRKIWDWMIGKYPILIGEFGGVSGGRGIYNGEFDTEYFKSVIDIVNANPLLVHYVAFSFDGCSPGDNAPCLFLGEPKNPISLTSRGRVVVEDLINEPPTKFR